MRRRSILSVPLLALAPAVSAAETAAGTSTAQARALFDDYWQWVLRAYPDYATLFVGDHRYADRLRDESAAAVRERGAAYARFAERAARLDPAAMTPQDRVSLRVLQHRLDSALEFQRLHGALPFGLFDSWAPVTQFDGLHLQLPQLARVARFATVSDYEAWLKRLDAVPHSVTELIARMRTARDAGWMPSGAAIARVPKQLEAQLDPDPRKNPQFEPFTAFPVDIGADDRHRLALAAERTISAQVIPAFRALKRFYESEYLPAAPQQLGVSRLPPGPPYYEALLRLHTTIDMTPRQVHELGLGEVARIGARMDAAVTAAGFGGARAEFQKFISTDPQFFHSRAEDMLAGYRDIAKRADAALPALFAELPRQTYGIRAMRPEEGDNAEHYIPGAADGSRPGWFEANVNDLKTRPKWNMETLLLHEAVPGHHLQTARAQELKELPEFRRHAWFPAFDEGWALYAETLGDEMGFYKDPYQRFGHLSWQMMRACRLVVDSGLHAFGWTREQAIDYLVSNTGQTRDEMVAEIDRYLVWPGQAAAYKIGELKINALRAKAKAALGRNFDLRRFHNAVIDGGALPLAVLEQQIDEWIAAGRASGGPP
jgi:uncharacterized protein (DUF885 family)